MEVIYSLKVMRKLLEMGFIPIKTIPNPKDVKYNCWIYEATDEFIEARRKILGGLKHE